MAATRLPALVRTSLARSSVREQRKTGKKQRGWDERTLFLISESQPAFPAPPQRRPVALWEVGSLWEVMGVEKHLLFLHIYYSGRGGGQQEASFTSPGE